MKLKSIELENFRCFRNVKLDLSADIVAIYGRNGVGKTSIFDGLEIAFMGGIGRYASIENPKSVLNNAFTNANCRVKVEFEDREANWIEISSASDRVDDFKISSSGAWKNHRDFLYGYFVREEYEPPRREIEPISELIRSSVLLSQESIRNFIVGEARDRARIIANIAGNAYVQKCLQKAESVSKELLQKKKVNSEQRSVQGTFLKEKEVEINEYEIRFKEYKQHGQLDQIEWTSVESRIVAGELLVDLKEPQNLEEVEALVAVVRKMCSEKYSALSERSTLLVEVESFNLQYEDRVQKIEKMKNLLIAKKGQASSFDSAMEITQKEIEQFLNKSEEVSNGVRRAIDRAERFRKLSQLRLEADKLNNGIATQQQATDKLKEKYQTAEKFYNEKREILEALNREKNNISLANSREKEHNERLEKIISEVSLQQQRVKNRLESESQIKLIEEQRGKLHSALAVKEREYGQLEQERKKIDAEQKAIEAQIGELKRLIAQIMKYAKDDQCPVCGHAHKSNAILRASIESQIRSIPASDKLVLERGQSIDHALVECKKRIEELHGSILTLDSEQQKCKDIMSQCDEEIRNFKIDVESLGINEGQSDLGAILKGLLEKSTELISSRAVSLKKIEEKIANEEVYSNNAKYNAEVISKGIVDKSSIVEKELETLERVRQDIAALGISDEQSISNEEIEDKLASLRKEIEANQNYHAEFQQKLIEAKNKLEQLALQKKTNDNDLLQTEQLYEQWKKEVDQFRNKCSELGFKESEAATNIEQERSKIVKRQRALKSLLEDIEVFRAQRTRDYLEIEQKKKQEEMRKIQVEITKLEDELTQIESASAIADGWIRELYALVDSSVSKTLEAYLKDIKRYFKSMLPFPYMFEDIIIDKKDTGVVLDLVYRGAKKASGEPKYFLSSAQANILALAVFLTLASKQRWSKLETIMLDDPVQHLDDLDAVAFLDVIRNLSLGKMGKRNQIIISTCDLNLYLLMLRKYSLIEKAGVSFSAISITNNGLNPEIRYDIKCKL